MFAQKHLCALGKLCMYLRTYLFFQRDGPSTSERVRVWACIFVSLCAVLLVGSLGSWGQGSFGSWGDGAGLAPLGPRRALHVLVESITACRTFRANGSFCFCVELITRTRLCASVCVCMCLCACWYICALAFLFIRACMHARVCL